MTSAVPGMHLAGCVSCHYELLPNKWEKECEKQMNILLSSFQENQDIWKKLNS